MTMRVLVVEDATAFRKMVAQFLRTQGYEVYEAWSLESARRLLPSIQPRIMILDLQLEDGDGYSILREHADDKMSIIVVSMREAVVDRVNCLELGADDYMVKPVDMRELALRIKRVEKFSTSPEQPGLIDLGVFVLDSINRKVIRAGAPETNLFQAEFQLARLFIESAGRVLSRHAIARHALGKSVAENSRAVDVLVSKLRKKISPPNQPLISSVRGEGYLFAVNGHARAMH